MMGEVGGGGGGEVGWMTLSIPIRKRVPVENIAICGQLNILLFLDFKMIVLNTLSEF